MITLLLEAKSVARVLARARAMRLGETQIKNLEQFLADLPKQLEDEQE
jgi:hypothetical protein